MNGEKTENNEGARRGDEAGGSERTGDFRPLRMPEEADEELQIA